MINKRGYLIKIVPFLVSHLLPIIQLFLDTDIP